MRLHGPLDRRIFHSSKEYFMKKLSSVLSAFLTMFLLIATPQTHAASAVPAKIIRCNITIKNEATGDFIGHWSITTQDGVPMPIQTIREIPYRSLACRVTIPSDPSSPTIAKETTEKSVIKVGTTLMVVPHIMPNGDIMTSLLLSYTTLEAMRKASFEGQTIDLPYTTTINAGETVLTTSAKPQAVFELNPQDNFMKPGDHGYGLPLMFKVSARIE